jgi:hypothetical protein
MEQPVESLSRFLVREIFSALQGLLAKLDRFNEAGFFREIPADSLLRERICVTASMGGKFRKLVLLFRREVYFHISQSRGVIPACQRALASQASQVSGDKKRISRRFENPVFGELVLRR